MSEFFIGVDPGKSGAVAVIQHDGSFAGVCNCDESPRDIARHIAGLTRSHAVIEKVSAMPKQGVASTFRFGYSAGMLEGIMAAVGIPYDFITPVKWQTAMKCRSKGDKNVTKAAAARLFPNIKVTHAIADALLLAEYCRRFHLGLIHQ